VLPIAARIAAVGLGASKTAAGSAAFTLRAAKAPSVVLTTEARTNVRLDIGIG
jgi:hypothetical protein